MRPENSSGRLARWHWCVKLQQFEFDIVHKKKKDNVVPDVLSRAQPEISLVDVTVSEKMIDTSKCCQKLPRTQTVMNNGQ
jgi:hypothetical protein